jgi:hypothetical protein
LAACLLISMGCGREQPPEPEPPTPTLAVETGRKLVLPDGRAFHLSDGFEGEEDPEHLPVSSDGAARLALRPLTGNRHRFTSTALSALCIAAKHAAATTQY